MKKVLFSLFLLISILGYSQTRYSPLIDDNGKVILTSDGSKVLSYPILDPNNWEYESYDEDWIKVQNVANNEIWILAFDGASNKYSAFTVTCVGGYIVDIYGGSNGTALLSTITKTSGSEYEFEIPTGAGKYCSSGGYYTYKIVIRSAIGNNSITDFSVSHHSLTTTTQQPFKIMNFGTKNILGISCIDATSNSGAPNATWCPYLIYVNTYYCKLIQNNYLFANSTSLLQITMAETMDELLYLGQYTGGYGNGSFQNCTSLINITLPNSMNKLIALGGYNTGFNYGAGTFTNCTSLQEVVMPNSLNSLKYLGCYAAPPYNDVKGAFYGCASLTSIKFPLALPSLLVFGAYSNSLPAAAGSFYYCLLLDTIKGVTSYPAYSIPFLSNGLRALTTFNQPNLRCSSFTLTGVSNADRSNINYIQIDWANSQFTGNVDIRYNNLSSTELDRIFTALPTVVVSRTIYVASNVGSATCDPTIATAKNWIVITS